MIIIISNIEHNILLMSNTVYQTFYFVFHLTQCKITHHKHIHCNCSEIHI